MDENTFPQPASNAQPLQCAQTLVAERHYSLIGQRLYVIYFTVILGQGVRRELNEKQAQFSVLWGEGGIEQVE